MKLELIEAIRNLQFIMKQLLFQQDQEIAKVLEKLNSKQMKILKASRKELFEKYEQQALRPLPLKSFDFSQWKKAKVNIDYHVELDGHYYSVPCNYVREEVEICFSLHSVTILKEGTVI